MYFAHIAKQKTNRRHEIKHWVMILMDFFNIEWTWNSYWNGYNADGPICMTLAWGVGMALMCGVRVVDKKINDDYDEERDGAAYKFAFWLLTIICLGSALFFILDGVLLHIDFDSDSLFLFALFGFIAFNALKLI